MEGDTSRSFSQSESAFREIFEHHSAVMLLLDAESLAILDANPAAERFYGYSREQLRGVSFQEVHPDLNQGGLTNLQGSTVLQCRCADGSTRAVSARVSKANLSGRPCWFALVDEISGDRASTLALRCLESAAWQTTDSVMITDASGIIQYVNPAFETCTGYSRAEVIGQNPRILKSGRQSAEFYANLWQTISSGATWTGTLLNRRKNGTVFAERATMSAVRDADGRVTNYVAVKKDLSREQSLEEQVRLSQRLQAVGRLAGSVAHDFKNVLTVINGYSELLLRRLGDDEPTRRCLQEISNAGNRAAALAQQLLTFSRGHALENRLVDINALVMETQNMLQRLIGDDVWFSASLDPKAVTIFADPVQVVQVLMNLAINARDAMPHGGSLHVKTEQVEMDSYCAHRYHVKPGRFVRLSISDTGIGMDAETQAHIFEPYFTTKPEGIGTGLGLATVHEIVTGGGGCICVESTLGCGTTFQVCFPYAEQSSSAPVAHAQQSTAAGRETVLLVEQQESLRRLACETLESQGYRVLEAQDEQETLQMVDAVHGPIHLLLTDIALPHAGGRALAARVRERRPDIQVLYMSGQGTVDGDAIRQERAAWVQKPFSQEELAAKVRDAIALKSRE